MDLSKYKSNPKTQYLAENLERLLKEGVDALTQEAFDKFKPMKEKDLTEEYAILETRRASASRIKTSVVHVASVKEPSEALAKNIARVGTGQVRRISCLDDLKTLMR